MNSNDYDVYASECIALGRSIVIKSSQTIDVINSYLTLAGHVIPEATFNNGNGYKEWKYYKNLNGQYYLDPVDPDNPRMGYDTKMYIKSLDTGEQILFSKAELDLHPLTKSDYSLNSRFFKELLTRFPEQEDLVRRILRPISMEKAFKAKNFEILQYDTFLVEDNEYNLISSLQDWIYKFTGRYCTLSFGVHHKLFPAAYLATVCLLMVPIIINLRLRNCKTPFVHSYHVWKHIGGYYGLGVFKNTLPRAQALWLYRNIDYIVENSGTNNTLDYLNKEFANAYGLQLNQISVEKDSSRLVVDLKHDTVIRRNEYGDDRKRVRYSTTTSLYDQLKLSAFNNSVRTPEKEAKLITKLNKTPSTVVPSGIIEATTHMEGSQGISDYMNERFKQWFFLSAINTPGSFNVKFLLELTTGETLLLSPSEAAVILLWIGRRVAGEVDDTIPKFWVTGVPYKDSRSYLQYRAMIEQSVPTEYLDDGIYEGIIYKLDDSQPRDVVSIEDFRAHSDTVTKRMVMNKMVIAKESTALGKSFIRSAINAFLVDAELKFTQYTTFTRFFEELGINFNENDHNDNEILASTIIRNIVGDVSISSGLPRPYLEMSEIINILSSYTTLIIPGRGNADSEYDTTWLYSPELQHEIDEYNNLDLTKLKSSLTTNNITFLNNDVNISLLPIDDTFSIHQCYMPDVDKPNLTFRAWANTAIHQDAMVPVTGLRIVSYDYEIGPDQPPPVIRGMFVPLPTHVNSYINVPAKNQLYEMKRTQGVAVALSGGSLLRYNRDPGGSYYYQVVSGPTGSSNVIEWFYSTWIIGNPRSYSFASKDVPMGQARSAWRFVSNPRMDNRGPEVLLDLGHPVAIFGDENRGIWINSYHTQGGYPNQYIGAIRHSLVLPHDGYPYMDGTDLATLRTKTLHGRNISNKTFVYYNSLGGNAYVIKYDYSAGFEVLTSLSMLNQGLLSGAIHYLGKKDDHTDIILFEYKVTAGQTSALFGDIYLFDHDTNTLTFESTPPDTRPSAADGFLIGLAGDPGHQPNWIAGVQGAGVNRLNGYKFVYQLDYQ